MARVHAPFFKFTSLFSKLKLQLGNPWVRSQPSFDRRSSGIKSSMRSSPQRSRWAAELLDVLDASDALKKSHFRSFSMIRSFSLKKWKPLWKTKLFKTGDFDGFLPEKNPMTFLVFCASWPGLSLGHGDAQLCLSVQKTIGSWFTIFFPIQLVEFCFP